MQLENISLFEDLTEKEIKEAEKHVRKHEFTKGEPLFSIYHEADSFFLILEGEVYIVRNEQTIAIRTPGEIIGEQSLIDNAPRSADAVSSIDTTCLEIFIGIFKNEVISNKIYKKLLATLSEKLREATLAKSVSFKREKAMRQQLRENNSIKDFEEIIRVLDKTIPHV